MVSGYVVCDEPKTWSQCSGVAKGSWSWQLQYCLELASQAASCDGPTRTRSVEQEPLKLMKHTLGESGRRSAVEVLKERRSLQ